MPFNILICEAGQGYGGSGAFLFSFLRHLNRDVFHPIVVYSQKAEGPFIKKIGDLDVDLVFLSESLQKAESKEALIGRWNLSRLIPAFFWRKLVAIYRRLVSICGHLVGIYRLACLIRKGKVHLVLSNQDVVFNPPGVLAAAICRIPCVVRKAGLSNYRGRWLLRFLSRFPTVLVASSNAEYQNHINLGLPFRNMVTVWEGVDVAEFMPSSGGNEVRRELGIPLTSLIVGSISRFDNGKGHEDFLRAAESVLKEAPDTVFLIVGGGDESIKAELIHLVQSLGIEDRVIFAGWRTDVVNILNAIDVFVHCPNTWLEGMGIATLEAISCGKPVVITNNWGLADTTVDGYNGFVVPIGDYRRLADKIILLLKDNELRRQMGENSRARAVQEFDIRKNVRLIEAVMLDTVKGAKLCIQQQ